MYSSIKEDRWWKSNAVAYSIIDHTHDSSNCDMIDMTGIKEELCFWKLTGSDERKLLAY